MKFLLSICLLLTVSLVNAQRFDKVIQNTDSETLEKIATEQKAVFTADSMRAAEYLKKNQLPKVYELENGFKRELIGINDMGEHIYFQTDNLQSAETIGTDKVQSAAPNGYNLNGSGLAVGVWDGGKGRNTHREFGSRMTQIDGSANISGHATHVSGTIGASGVRTDAKGMAPSISLSNYDWGQNTSEMAAAASNGMLVSNHSYGTGTGWRRSGSNWSWSGNNNISPVEDYRFGFYGSSASAFDQIAVAAPYFLIVKSAGNDRDDGPSTAGSPGVPNPDPDYGSISSYSMAKNILVVGAVEGITGGYLSPAQVQMTSFSCWGPTDDGRIRPDVVAKGRGVLSTWGNGDASYNSIQGTSMSSPAVAGSAILLQEQYENFNGTGNFMKSASLRALIIHTADEAGTSTGPDYRFGWGLMNTKKAADLIADTMAYIIEDRISTGNPHQIKVVVEQTRDVRLTLAWTDPAANPLPASLNPSTLVLINDLDIRLKSTTSSAEYKPFVLNPAAPAAPATRGDNFRDNIEQVFAQNVPAGVYTIEISHKGASLLNGHQDYSLIAEGVGILPEVQFSVANDQLCVGETATLIGSGSSDVIRFEWKVSNSGLQLNNSSTSTSTATGISPGNYDIRLVAYNSRGKDSVLIQNAVIVHNNPVVVIDSSDIFCVPDNNVKSIGANIDGGNWNGGNWMPFSDTVLFVPSTVGAGDYQLVYRVNDVNGCFGEDSTIVRLRNAPNVSLSQLDSVYRIDKDSLLSGGIPSGGKYYVNNILDSMLRPQSLGRGFHQVSYEYSDTNGCVSRESKMIELVVTTGITEFNTEDLRVAPNPFNSGIRVSSSKILGELRVYDISGRLVYSEVYEGTRAKLNLSQLESGIYILKTSSNQSIKITKTQ